MFAQLLVSALAFNGPAALMTRGAPGSSITMAAKKAVKPVKAVKAVKASKPVKATKAPKPQADYGISGGARLHRLRGRTPAGLSLRASACGAARVGMP